MQALFFSHIANDDTRDNLGVSAMDIGVVRMLAVVTLD
jgi:hypothetical protein